MTKKELIEKFNEISINISDAKRAVDDAIDSLDAISRMVDYLPQEEDEIDDSEEKDANK